MRWNYSNGLADDGTLGTEADTGQFWVLFGGFAPLSKKPVVADDASGLPKPKLLWYAKPFLLLPIRSLHSYVYFLLRCRVSMNMAISKDGQGDVLVLCMLTKKFEVTRYFHH